MRVIGVEALRGIRSVRLRGKFTKERDLAVARREVARESDASSCR